MRISERMDILYVTNLPAPYKITFLENLAQKINLTVIYERKTATNRNEKWRINSTNCYEEIFLDGINVGNEATFSLKIIKFIKKNKYDIVLMNGYSSPTAIIAILYMKLNKIKYAIVCDGMLPTQDSKFKFWIKKNLISKAFFWLSTGEITTKQLIKYGANREHIFKYPFSSVLAEELVREYPNKKHYRKKIGSKEDFIILYVGQFIDRKGIDILFKAVKTLANNVQLIMVGGTKEEASKYDGYDNEAILYVGFKTKEELRDYYLAADVFVFPTREDIWGLVVNEALATGLPVITTNKCGAGLSLITNGYNGYIIESEDSQALANAINESLNKIDILTKNVISAADDWTIEKMSDRTYEVLKKMLCVQ